MQPYPPQIYKLFPVVFFMLVFARSAHALELQYPHIPGFGDVFQTLNTLNEQAGGITIAQVLQFIFASSLWLAGIMAFGALLIAFFVLATSTGSPWKRLQSQRRIRDILVGVVILLGLWIFLANINPQLLTLGGTSFRICTIGGGFANCNNPANTKFPDIPNQGGATQALPNSVCIYSSHDLSKLNSAPNPFDIAKNCPTIISIPGNENLYNLPIINASGDILGNYDGKVLRAVVTGNTKATFYQYPDNNTGAGGSDKGWIEITVHGITYTCKQKFSGSDTTQDCLSKVTGDNRNKAGIFFIDFDYICLKDKNCIPKIGDNWNDDVSSIKVQYYGGVGGGAGGGGTGGGGTGGGGSGTFACPIPASCNRITTRFGDPGTINGLVHNAIDVDCAINQPITAPFAGTVTSASFIDQCGLQVTISSAVDPIDGKRWTTKFCHMNSIAVSSGDDVTVGTSLGGIDSTGASTGNHAHICLQKGGTGQCWQNEDTTINVNPENYMSCHFTH